MRNGNPTNNHGTNESIEEFDIAVLGLGFSGAFTVEELSTRMRVVAIDANDAILGKNSTSRNECFKLHTGVHYIGDEMTAITCLQNSVAIAHNFSEQILNKDNPAAPTRRGRHYLMSNSLFAEKEVREICTKLQEKYKRLLKQFPNAKKIFGEPENFITYLNPEDYPYVANNIPFTDQDGKVQDTHVILGIETPECQIDINAFRTYFKNVFEHLERKNGLRLLLGHKVKQLNHHASALGYTIKTSYQDKQTGETFSHKIKAKCLINCTWNKIEELNKQLGFLYEGDRINRIKIITRVPLLPKLRGMNTCIFFAGPHTSITNIPTKNGEHEAILTYEPVTNAGFYACGTPTHRLPEELRQLESGRLSPNQGIGQEYSKKIIEGVARYIPAFQWGEQATEVTIGHVKNFFMPEDEKYLYDRKSEHHRRLEDGVEILDVGLIAFSGMKMTYTYRVSEEMLRLVTYHLHLRTLLAGLIKSICNELKLEDNHFKPALLFHMKCSLMCALAISINPSTETLEAIMKAESSFSTNNQSQRPLSAIIEPNSPKETNIITKTCSAYSKAIKERHNFIHSFHRFASQIHNTPNDKLSTLQKKFKQNSSSFFTPDKNTKPNNLNPTSTNSSK